MTAPQACRRPVTVSQQAAAGRGAPARLARLRPILYRAGVAILAVGLTVGCARAADDGGPELEAAVRAYVESARQVRQAQARLDAARLEFRRRVEVASSPTLSLSTSMEWAARDGLSGLAVASAGSDGTATVAWSPIAPLTFTATVRVAEDTRVTSGPDLLQSSQQRVSGQVARLDASWTVWPPPNATSRNLSAEQSRLDLLDAERGLAEARRQASIDGRLWYARLRVRAAQLAVARWELEAALGQVERAVAQRQAGLVGEDAVLQARAVAQRAAASVQQAASALRSAEQALGRSAGDITPLPPASSEELRAYARREASRALSLTREVLSGLLPGSPPWPPESAGEMGLVLEVPALPQPVKQRVVEESPEVTLARSRLVLARRQLQATQANWGSASVFVGTQTSESRSGGASSTGPSTSWSVGLSARLTLLDGGARRADEEQARRSVEEAELALTDAARTVADDLELRWHAMGQAALNVFAARAALDQAELSQAVAEVRARQGAASAAELEEAQRAAARAALDLVEAAATLQAELQRLQVRVGGAS